MLHSSVSLAFTGLEDRQKLYLIGYYIVSIMIPRNFERENAIYELWLQDYTIDEISSKTGIPRSTVGYYVAKFNKSKNEDKPRSKPPTNQAVRNSKTTRIMNSFGWTYFSTHWGRLMAEEKYLEAKTMTEAALLYNRLQREAMHSMKGEEEITIEDILSVGKWFFSLQSEMKGKEGFTIKDATDILKTLSSSS